MLSLLEIKSDNEKLSFREIISRVTKPSVSAQMVPACNIHYLRITARERKGKIDWRMIGAYSLDYSERLLLPLGVEPPAESGLRRYIPHEYRRRQMENFAIEVLNRIDKRPELRRVAVYGQENEVVALLPRLTAAAGEVRVISRRPHAVADTAEALNRATGAAVTVESELNAAGFDVLLAPAGGAGVFRLSEDTVVISPDRPSVPVTVWIKDTRPSLPQVLESEYDGRYDLTEFTGAFYEAAEMRELGRISPAAGITESGELTASDTASLITQSLSLS